MFVRVFFFIILVFWLKLTSSAAIYNSSSISFKTLLYLRTRTSAHVTSKWRRICCTNYDMVVAWSATNTGVATVTNDNKASGAAAHPSCCGAHVRAVGLLL